MIPKLYRANKPPPDRIKAVLPNACFYSTKNSIF